PAEQIELHRDRVIVPAAGQVIQLRAVVQTVADGRIATLDQLVEEATHPVPVRRASEGRVLPRHAQPAEQHHDVEKARLALREAELRDGSDPVFQLHTNSSAMSGSNGLPPPRLDPAPIRPLNPR